MDVTLDRTTARDPAYAELASAQEREMSQRYRSPDPGPGALDDDAALVARLDGEPVGCVAVHRLSNEVGEVKRLYVRESARGHRIGRRLLQGAEDLARDLGYRSLRLEVGDRQPEALAIYRSSAWHEIEPYGYFKDYPGVVCFERHLREAGSAAAGERMHERAE